MSGATVSINKKWDDGTLVSVGGVGFTDFASNLAGFVGDDDAITIIDAVKRSLIPASAGSAPPRAQRDEPQGYQADSRPAPQQQQSGSGDVFCASHQRPARAVEKKDGSGVVYKCAVNDTFISNWGKPGIKDFCPRPKQ